MSVPAPVGSPTVSVGSAATSRSGTFDFTSRSSSFDITSMRDEILPTQCYICQAKFSPTVHSVLQLCDCRVGICQQCALNNMTLNEDLSLDCQICGSKVNSGTNTGIIRNVTKVRQLTDKYLDRGFKFYGLHAPPKKDPTISHYYPLVLKYGKEANLQPHVVDFLRAETTDSAEPGTQTRDRKKLNVHYLKLVLARVEHLRAGPLTDETFEVGNLSLPEGDLPLGPLAALSLTRNVFLEKILSGQELEAACKTCGEHIHQGESILFSCDCESLLCHGCAINGFVESKYTYRKGVCCPVCKRNSMISLGSLEKAKEEEGAIIELMVKKYAPEGAHYTAKSIQDLRKLLEHLYALGLASHVRTHEEVHALSFQQVELEIARIYVALERKKSRHDKLVKKDKKHAIYRKTHAQGDVKEAEEGDKSAKKAEKKKGEKEPEQLPAEHVVTYESKEDETYLHSASELDAGFDLPIGPMRLFKFSRNPYVEMYLYSTYGEIEPEEQGLADFMKMFRFNPYKPKFNTCCPRCSINPQNAEYLKRHLKTVHNVSRKDEVDKIMKGVNIEPVALDFPAAVDAAPPAPAGYNLFGQKA